MGAYRSFQTRSWPTAEINDKPAFYISCATEYSSGAAQREEHAPLFLYCAKYNETGKFNWVRKNTPFRSIGELKKYAKTFVAENKEYFEKYFSPVEEEIQYSNIMIFKELCIEGCTSMDLLEVCDSEETALEEVNSVLLSDTYQEKIESFVFEKSEDKRTLFQKIKLSQTSNLIVKKVELNTKLT